MAGGKAGVVIAANIGLPVIVLGLVAVAVIVYGLGFVFARGARRGS